MSNIIKTMSYEIIKPVDCDWNTFGKLLRDLQYETRKILNKSISLAWEYDDFASDYKKIFGQYLKTENILNYKTILGYVYDRLKSEYYKLNTGNFTETIKKATDKWKNNKIEVWKGNENIPSFKNKNSPIDVVKKSIQVIKEDNNYYLNLSLISTKYKKELDRKSGQFLVLIKPGDKIQRVILERIISGEYDIGTSQIVQKKNKWFVNLVYKFQKEKTSTLNQDNIMGIDLGIKKALYMSFNNSRDRYYIDGGEIDDFRKKTEKRRNEYLRQGKYCADGRIGHGRETRIKPIQKLQNKVENFKNTTNHKYSRYVIEIALKYNCKTIQMEKLEGINKNSVFLKNWTYYDLQQKIEYKARECGIEIKYINPKYTSQRCSKCGYIHSDNRENQETFHCKSCGFKTNADYNASQNIATKDIEEIIENTLEELKAS